MEELAQQLMAKFPILGIILAALGTLVVIAQAIVIISPSKKDDEKMAELMKKSIVKKVVEWLKGMSLIHLKK